MSSVDSGVRTARGPVPVVGFGPRQGKRDIIRMLDTGATRSNIA